MPNPNQSPAQRAAAALVQRSQNPPPAPVLPPLVDFAAMARDDGGLMVVIDMIPTLNYEQDKWELRRVEGEYVIQHGAYSATLPEFERIVAATHPSLVIIAEINADEAFRSQEVKLP